MQQLAQQGILAACALTLCACATTNPSKPALAARYNGVWVNANPRYPNNFWVIAAGEAVSYGIGQDGKCERIAAVILGPARIDVQSGRRGIGSLRLAEGGLLIFVGDDAVSGAIYRQADASSVCRRSDGTYADGAPLIGRSR
jgi:hypothetical protein